MKKVDIFILIAILILCSVLTSKKAMDFTVTIRNMVWGVGIIILFIMVTARALEGQVDLSILRRMIFPIFGCFLIVSIFSISKAANKGEAYYEVLKLAVQIITLFLFVIIIQGRTHIFIK